MNLLENIFEWVVSTTIRASLVAVAILAIQMMLRPWMPAKWRHPLWLPLLLVMVLPFVPALPIHIIPARASVAAPTASLSVAAPEATGDVTAPTTTNAIAPAPQQKLPVLPLLWMAGVLVTLTAGITGYRSKLKAIRARAVSPSPELQMEIEKARKAAAYPRHLSSGFRAKWKAPPYLDSCDPCFSSPRSFPPPSPPPSPA